MADESIFQKIAGAVGTYAPGIAGILAATGVGAPAAGAVAALGALAKQFGLPEDATHEQILTRVSNADPEQNLKLIAAENAFQLAMRDYDIKELQAKVADTAGAQKMSTDKMKITGKGDLNLYILAWTVVVGFYGLTTMLLYFSYIGKPITDNTGVLFMLLGNMATAFGIVLHFFYGSNTGSADTKQMLLNATPIKK